MVRAVSVHEPDLVEPGGMSAPPPRRIVSLVPTATEILFGLGVGDRLVGRSRYDDYPPEVLRIRDVGDAIRPSVETILLCSPDLVLLIGGSDNAGAAREMARLGVPFLSLRFNSLDDLRRNILLLGSLVGRASTADAMWRAVQSELARVQQLTSVAPRPRVYYDVGFPPAFTVGAGSYLDTLITIAGGRNVFGDLAIPAPRVSLEAILARDPDVVVFPVSSDPTQRALPPAERPGWRSVRAVGDGRIVIVDADLLHRLGPRVGRAARQLAIALHPEVFEDRDR